jgi:hypothetical protein
MSPVRCSQLFQYLRVNAGIVIAGKSSFIHLILYLTTMFD